MHGTINIRSGHLLATDLAEVTKPSNISVYFKK
jgi:hypothetical protein